MFEFFQAVGKQIEFKDYDILYIRYGLSFVGFISFLRQAKQSNARLKILLEFPTFPYKEEWTGTRGLVVKKVDGHYRKKLSRYVDHAIHLGEEKEILGIPCINSENGIGLSEIKVKRMRDVSDHINLIAVGKWQFWHGLDRLIKGIAELGLISKQRIKLLIVGEGPAIKDLKILVEELDLSKQVSFEGARTGKELDRLYDNADLGIGTLGMHRKNVRIDSSLKHRAYAGRGLPFILSTKDMDFPSSLEFVKYYEETDDAINIESLIEFGEQMKNVDPDLIRKYAIDKLSWKSKMSRILEVVNVD